MKEEIQGRLVVFGIGAVFTLLTLGCMVMDGRVCQRGSYEKRFGPKSSSLWMLPALVFGMIAFFFLGLAFKGPMR
jgi:hypothetical protein